MRGARVVMCIVASVVLQFSAASLSDAKRPGGGAIYTITDLGTLGGPRNFEPSGVNNAGLVVGIARTPSNELHAVVWEDGAITDVHPESAYRTVTHGVSPGGQICGWAWYESAGTPAAHPVVWDRSPDGWEMTDLGLPDTFWEGFAVMSNDTQIVGGGYLAEDQEPPRALVWTKDPDGTGFVVTVLSPGIDAYACDINAGGQVVGCAWLSDGAPVHAVLWEQDAQGLWWMADLGTLPGMSYSRAAAINQQGHVAGCSGPDASVGGDERAFLLVDSEMFDLGSLNRYPEAAAGDVNSEDQVVGTAWVQRGIHLPEHRAFSWKNGTMTDLTASIGADSGWFKLLYGTAVNDSGWIVGFGMKDKDDISGHGFLLKPR